MTRLIHMIGILCFIHICHGKHYTFQQTTQLPACFPTALAVKLHWNLQCPRQFKFKRILDLKNLNEYQRNGSKVCVSLQKHEKLKLHIDKQCTKQRKCEVNLSTFSCIGKKDCPKGLVEAHYQCETVRFGRNGM